jgi:hypothetical protein
MGSLWVTFGTVENYEYISRYHKTIQKWEQHNIMTPIFV